MYETRTDVPNKTEGPDHGTFYLVSQNTMPTSGITLVIPFKAFVYIDSCRSVGFIFFFNLINTDGVILFYFLYEEN